MFKVAGDKVLRRWNQNNRAHAVSACISLWCNRLDACTSKAYACLYCMHYSMMSQANACSYCMGSLVLILSRIYLYLQLLWIVLKKKTIGQIFDALHIFVTCIWAPKSLKVLINTNISFSSKWNIFWEVRNVFLTYDKCQIFDILFKSHAFWILGASLLNKN